jgi:hypothetical protein
MRRNPLERIAMPVPLYESSITAFELDYPGGSR